VLEVSEKVLSAITRRDNPQMVVGVFASAGRPLKDVRPKGNDVWVGARPRARSRQSRHDHPHRRRRGAKGVILIGETTDPFSLETVRATMGSVFAVPRGEDQRRGFLQWRKGFPGLVAGTHLKGAVDYRSIDYGHARCCC
jgi:TrmH family RNA methyltransferase